ncbi:MAG TPA: PaaI family thioesterase [Amaricoccus sp.]|nr:PaaI family thioesterase [Amaricoccus sp.]
MSEDRAQVERRIRVSFARQGLMQTLGATLGDVSPGQVEILLVPKREISQQHGFVHAGAVSAIADSAAGYAALSMMPPDRGVLTAEFKINLLAPAVGECLIASGRSSRQAAPSRSHNPKCLPEQAGNCGLLPC